MSRESLVVLFALGLLLPLRAVGDDPPRRATESTTQPASKPASKPASEAKGADDSSPRGSKNAASRPADAAPPRTGGRAASQPAGEGDSAMKERTDAASRPADPAEEMIRQMDAAPAAMRPPNWDEVKRRMRRQAPAVGETAPDFELTKLEGDGRVRRSAAHAGRPQVLIFGSFT